MALHSNSLIPNQSSAQFSLHFVQNIYPSFHQILPYEWEKKVLGGLASISSFGSKIDGDPVLSYYELEKKNFDAIMLISIAIF